MCDLNIKNQQVEYSRIMEKRIRFYAKKYDPHTVIYDDTVPVGEETRLKKVDGKRISLLREIFLNIF